MGLPALILFFPRFCMLHGHIPGTLILFRKQMSEDPSHKGSRKKYLPAKCHGKVHNRCLDPFGYYLGIHSFKKKGGYKASQCEKPVSLPAVPL